MFFRKNLEDKVAEKVATKVFDNFKEKKPKKVKKPAKRSMIRDIFENTDDYELVARKEGEEFVIRVRKPEVNTFYSDNLKTGNVDVNKLADEIEKQWERLENV